MPSHLLTLQQPGVETAEVAGDNLLFVILLLQLSLKVVGNTRVFPAYLLLESSYWPKLILGRSPLKHMYWEKAPILYLQTLANNPNLP